MNLQRLPKSLATLHVGAGTHIAPHSMSTPLDLFPPGFSLSKCIIDAGAVALPFSTK